jgi:hypothetical protein
MKNKDKRFPIRDANSEFPTLKSKVYQKTVLRNSLIYYKWVIQEVSHFGTAAHFVLNKTSATRTNDPILPDAMIVTIIEATEN